MTSRRADENHVISLRNGRRLRTQLGRREVEKQPYLLAEKFDAQNVDNRSLKLYTSDILWFEIMTTATNHRTIVSPDVNKMSSQNTTGLVCFRHQVLRLS